MKDKLNAIKKFADENWCKPYEEQFYIDDEEFALANPWIDHSGRFSLTDEEAVREWGLDEVLDYCIEVIKILNNKQGRN